LRCGSLTCSVQGVEQSITIISIWTSFL